MSEQQQQQQQKKEGDVVVVVKNNDLYAECEAWRRPFKSVSDEEDADWNDMLRRTRIDKELQHTVSPTELTKTLNDWDDKTKQDVYQKEIPQMFRDTFSRWCPVFFYQCDLSRKERGEEEDVKEVGDDDALPVRIIGICDAGCFGGSLNEVFLEVIIPYLEGYVGIMNVKPEMLRRVNRYSNVQVLLLKHMDILKPDTRAKKADFFLCPDGYVKFARLRQEQVI